MDGAPILMLKTYETIIQRILAEIQSGKFSPGSKLPSVRQLSMNWQVEQTAVQEALSALKAMNLVISGEGEGTRVNPSLQLQGTQSIPFLNLMEPQEIQHLLGLRMILEVGLVRLAAKRRTAVELKALSEMLAQMERDVAAVARLGETADWKFHHALARASKNPLVLNLMESIREQIESAQRASRFALYRLSGEPERLVQQHAAILQAVRDQNEEAAAQAMTLHLRHVEVGTGLITLLASEKGLREKK